MKHVSLKKYQQVTVSAAKEASPYQLVSMLFQELLGSIASAKGAIEQGKVASKGELISKALTIVSVLEGSIDFENGGEVSNNLAALYTFSSEKLLEANIKNDPSLLEEVITILLPIKAGWDAIPHQQQNDVSF